MTGKCFWCGVLMVSLSVVLAVPANAQEVGGPAPFGGKTGYNGPIVAAIVGALAAVAVLVIVAVHYSKKRAVTGCVVAGQGGMTLTDEKDKQTYMLSGDTTGVKPGDRMKLQGRKAKPKSADQTPVWEAKSEGKDFGVCKP
jgi:hypothetical protein